MSGCSTSIVQNNTEAFHDIGATKLDFPIHIDVNQKPGPSGLVEDNQYIYYCAGEEIYKVDKQNGKMQLISKQSDMMSPSMVLAENYLYFIKMKGYDFVVFRIDTDGNQYSEVFNLKQLKKPKIGDIRNILVKDNILYMDCEENLFSYNMDTKQLQFLIGDISKFYVLGDDVYYTDHAERTFTIYKKNLKTLKKEIILGEGKSSPKGTLYRYFAFLGDELYYSTQSPDGVYCYNKRNPIAISENVPKFIEALGEYKGEIYYVEDDTGNKLMKYNPKTKKLTEVAMLPFFSWGHDLNFVNGYLYYGRTDSILGSVKIEK